MAVSQIKLTGSGPTVSRLVFGAWRLANWGLSRSDRLRLIEACVELGITAVDHADIYGNYTCEQLFGEALAEAPALRDKLQLITKCGIKLISSNRPAHTLKHYDTSKAHLVASVENSLTLLRTDRLDLLLIHRPDPLMDPDEVAEAFTQLRESGKVLHFGVSNFTPLQFELLASRLSFPLVTNQIELSVVHLDALGDGTMDQCQRLRISPMAWSPLGGGSLLRDNSPSTVRLRQALSRVGAALGGATVTQVALAWLLSHPARIVPVLGTGKLDRIQESAGAEAFKLTREQWFTIWSASTGTEVP
jgi:predicted oxidoreductase